MMLSSKNTSKFISISEKIKSQISTGIFKVGDKIPSDRKLAKEFNVNFSTVNKALAHLAAQGYLLREHGRGTFVKERKREESSPQIIYVNGENIETDFTANYLNWFIRSEIQKGIINTSKTLVRFNSVDEILKTANKSSGVIIIGSEEKLTEKFKELNFPYVVIGQFKKQLNEFNAISSDHLAGAYEGVVYLAESLGHKNIGLITAGSSHYNRFAGYQIALRSIEIPFREELVVKAAGGTKDDGYSAMLQLLDSKIKITAVFVDTDIKAFGVIDAIKSRGLNVPDDISVLGFDDRPESALLSPALSTIKAPYYEMGQEAVNMINEMISQGNNKVPSKILKPHLLIRQSCKKIS